MLKLLLHSQQLSLEWNPQEVVVVGTTKPSARTPLQTGRRLIAEWEMAPVWKEKRMQLPAFAWEWERALRPDLQ